MKAVLFHGAGDIRVDDPELREDTDAILSLTASAICGTDLGISDAIKAYRAFDERQPGWLKVEPELST